MTNTGGMGGNGELQTVTVTLSASYGVVMPSVLEKAFKKYVKRNAYQRELMRERRRRGLA